MATTISAVPMKSSEGGWGYVIVASVFLMNFLFLGWLQLQTFFFVEWQWYFGATSLEASLLVSVGLVVFGLASSLGGVLAGIYGSRAVVMAGGLIVSLGMISTMLMDSIIGIILTWGVVKGFGFALVYGPSVVMIRQYFNQHFTIANGVAYTGAAIGQIVVPLLANSLIDAFGWRGAVWLLSAVMFHLVLCGVVLRPKLEQEEIADSSRKTESPFATDNNAYVYENESRLSSQRITVSAVSSGILEGNKAVMDGETLTNNYHSGPSSENTNMKLSTDRNIGEGTIAVLIALIKNARFDILQVVFFIVGFVLYAPIAHSVPRALKAGIDEGQAAVLPTIFGIGGLIGRLGPSLISDICHVPKDNINTCALLICTVANFLNPLLNSFWMQALYSFVYGMATGTNAVLTFTILQVILPPEQGAVGVGFATCFFAIGDGAGSLVAGWIFDTTGSYDVPYCVLGASAGLGALLQILVAYLSRRIVSNDEKKAKREDQHTMEDIDVKAE